MIAHDIDCVLGYLWKVKPKLVDGNFEHDEPARLGLLIRHWRLLYMTLETARHIYRRALPTFEMKLPKSIQCVTSFKREYHSACQLCFLYEYVLHTVSSMISCFQDNPDFSGGLSIAHLNKGDGLADIRPIPSSAILL